MQSPSIKPKQKCKCGTTDVIFVVQKGRSKKLEAFCENCLPQYTEEMNQKLKKRSGNNASPA